MKRGSKDNTGLEGWGWFDADTDGQSPIEADDLARCFARCFNGVDGEAVLRHLRQTFLNRRLGPSASDAELRFLEGQRSVAAHIHDMIDRGLGIGIGTD